MHSRYKLKCASMTGQPVERSGDEAQTVETWPLARPDSYRRVRSWTNAPKRGRKRPQRKHSRVRQASPLGIDEAQASERSAGAASVRRSSNARPKQTQLPYAGSRQRSADAEQRRTQPYACKITEQSHRVQVRAAQCSGDLRAPRARQRHSPRPASPQTRRELSVRSAGLPETLRRVRR